MRPREATRTAADIRICRTGGLFPVETEEAAPREAAVKPFLKWAGGKFKIRERVTAALPAGRRLVEPFTGSGAVFLNTRYPEWLLADCNPDLINLYRHIKEEGAGFVDFAVRYFKPENNTPDAYYALREEFNQSADTRLKAALFVYLNRHGFNGLCRYNAGGGFNVPFGRYRMPGFPRAGMLAFHAKAARARFETADFRAILEEARPGDVVYCDPPYVPLSPTASFTGYAAGGFGIDEQRDLADRARRLQARGIPMVISNHDTELTRQLYEGARIMTFDVQRFISADNGNRGKAAELLAVFG